MHRRHALACAIALTLAWPAASSAEDAADADAAFQASCASCHGAQGAGDTPAGRAMKVPSFPGSSALAGAEATAICERAQAVSQHAAMLEKIDAETLAAACRRVKELAAAGG